MPGHLVETPAELDLSRSRQEQAERDGLGIPISELRVGCVREEHLPPIHPERRQCRAPEGQLLGHLLTQQSAQPGADLGELFGVAWGDGLPLDEVLEEAQQAENSPPL